MGVMTREGYCTRVMYGIRIVHMSHTRTYICYIMYMYIRPMPCGFSIEKHPSGSLTRRVSLQKITRSTGVEWRKMGKIAGSLLYKVNNNTINTGARLRWRTWLNTFARIRVKTCTSLRSDIRTRVLVRRHNTFRQP